MTYTWSAFANSSCSSRVIELVVRREQCPMKHVEDCSGGSERELGTSALRRERHKFLNQVELPIVRYALAGLKIKEGWQFTTVLL